jgi:hypothetical protein
MLGDGEERFAFGDFVEGGVGEFAEDVELGEGAGCVEADAVDVEVLDPEHDGFDYIFSGGE